MVSKHYLIQKLAQDLFASFITSLTRTIDKKRQLHAHVSTIGTYCICVRSDSYQMIGRVP